MAASQKWESEENVSLNYLKKFFESTCILLIKIQTKSKETERILATGLEKEANIHCTHSVFETLYIY